MNKIIVVLMIFVLMLSGCAKTAEQKMDEAKSIRKDDPKRAIELYEEVLEEDEYNLDAWEGIAKIYEKEEDYGDLDKHLKKMFKDIDEFDDEDDVLDILDEYSEVIREEDSEELGSWYSDMLLQYYEFYEAEDTADETLADSETEVATVIPMDVFDIGLVTDMGGVNDGSFNQTTWQGIQRFGNDYGVYVDYIESEWDDEYIANLSYWSEQQMDVVVCPGFLFADALDSVAGNYPDTQYIILDMVVSQPNVTSVVFKEEEGSYLAGVAAGLKATEMESNKVGFVGGMDFALIQKFEAGFEAGVWAINPDIEVQVEYADSFADLQQGQTIASEMYDNGVSIIYHASGGTGYGITQEAKDRALNGQDVWVIGVDTDQYSDGIYDGSNSVVLTSMLKNLDVAVYDVAEKINNGNYMGGEILVYGIEQGGVSLADSNSAYHDGLKEVVRMYAYDVALGDIEVPEMPSRLK